ncbi:hypothetical protein NH26_23635 [Flammeovirga pacifica]|uniref:Secretion system C-terminal sorting domain-containing protein n=1 Tax=Flammeovirga pacifica TaxID=915059 RepID=A0A1S1YU62_FLAPC|nr:hypothetical protein NH26_23635 [Flammeovirga pacifica]
MVFSQAVNNELTAVFPEANVPQQGSTPLVFTEEYTSSESDWAISWGENKVFDCLLKYDSPINPNYSYELRIGKGGQVYSFITSKGETIAPQWRNPNSANGLEYGPNYSPWVDDVWQLVAVDKSLHDPENHEKYFIHQAGVYLKDPNMNNQQPFYSPQVASYYDAANESYTTVNWGQHAHVDENLKAGFTSEILYYTQYKNIGNGIIQVDYLIYNFGNDTMDHINAPWGGVRRSAYDHNFMSNSDNSYSEVVGNFSTLPNTKFTETNGWVAFSTNQSGTGPSMGLMVNNASGLMRVGDASGGDSRDFSVYSGIKNGFSIDFGKIYRIRNYFILQSSVARISEKVEILQLQERTFCDFESKTENEVGSTRYFFNQDDLKITTQQTNNDNGLLLKLQPYNDAYPLFKINGLNAKNEVETRITSDLYSFSQYPYDGHLNDIQLLGFTNSKKEVTLETVTITAGGNYTFPDGTIQNNLTEEVTYFSSLGTDANGLEQMIQTTVKIREGYFMWYENSSNIEKIDYSTHTNSIFATDISNPYTGGVNTNSIVTRLMKPEESQNPTVTFSMPKITDLTHLKIKLKACLNTSNLVPFGEENANQRFRVILRNSTQGGTGQLVSLHYFTNKTTWEEFTSDFTSSTIAQNIIDAGGFDQLLIYMDNTDTTRFNTYFIDQIKSTIQVNIVNARMKFEEELPESKLVLYPNPATKTFQLTEKVESVKIFNKSMQLLKVYNQDQEFYDISDLSNGLYILEFTDLNGLTNRCKLMKQ